MTKQLLTVIERNAVFALVTEFGLDPADFAWKEQNSESSKSVTISALEYTPTGHFVTFDHHSGGYMHVERPYYSRMCPGARDYTQTEEFYDRDGQVGGCSVWLARLKEEVEPPDLWAAIRSEKQLIEVSSAASDNSRFTIDELPRIQTVVDELRAFILRTETVNDESRARIEAQFAYIREASTRLGRKDWLTILVGGLVGLALQHLVGSTAVLQCLRMAASLLWPSGAGGGMIAP